MLTTMKERSMKREKFKKMLWREQL